MKKEEINDMGQRLNFEIISIEGIRTNVYYHWDGFTDSVLHHVLELNKSGARTYKEIIDHFQSKGARVTNNDNEYVINVAKEHDINIVIGNADRNNGLIGILQDDIRSTRHWAEQTATVDFQRGWYNLVNSFWKVTYIDVIIANHKTAPKIELCGYVDKLGDVVTQLTQSDHLVIYDNEMYTFVE